MRHDKALDKLSRKGPREKAGERIDKAVDELTKKLEAARSSRSWREWPNAADVRGRARGPLFGGAARDGERVRSGAAAPRSPGTQ
jgi:hypothetical protein